MRSIALLGVCLLIPALAGCGGSSPVPSNQGSEASRPIRDSAKPPRVTLPPGPPPKKLVVHDIREGFGPAIPAKGGVRIDTNFVALSYKTGKPFEVRWSPGGAFNIGFDPGREIKGWEKGLVGMKAGGRRELRIPSRLAYQEGAGFYVIDLLAVDRPPFK
jgi:peptidylprolyl isomerase